jgi:Zn-dependent protease with chaperone function
MESIKKPQEEIRKYQLAVVKQMLKLATAGFGLVAALAWNELIKATIDEYIKTRISVGSGIISLAVYALLVTFLAVFITLQLSRLEEKLKKKKTK